MLTDLVASRITCTIIAPTPFLAAIFILFAALSQKLGPGYGRLTPRWCKSLYFTSVVPSNDLLPHRLEDIFDMR